MNEADQVTQLRYVALLKHNKLVIMAKTQLNRHYIYTTVKTLSCRVLSGRYESLLSCCYDPNLSSQLASFPCCPGCQSDPPGMELTAPASLPSPLPAHTHSCRVSVVLLSSPPFSSFGGRASVGTFTLFASCLLPRLVRCRSALAAMFSDAATESHFVHFRRCPVIDIITHCV